MNKVANIDYRKRFMDTMLFKDTQSVPYIEIGIWGQTLNRWEKEGLPKGVLKDILFLEGDSYFKFEPKEFIKINSIEPVPSFEYKVIEEDNRYIVYVDEMGITHKALKEGEAHGIRMSMDQYIGFPVSDRDSFYSLKKRYETDISKRYPEDWNNLLGRWKSRNYPLVLLDNGQFGFYSLLRSWMGTEGLSYMLYDDINLIREMLEFAAEYFIKLTHKALHEIDIDYFNFWEDMSFKNGPLVSPEMFKELFLPHYKRIVDYLRSHGIDLIVVDTDGDPRKLLPLFIEAGVNGFWPIEITAGIDPIMLRKEYGNDLALIGGIDKRILAGNKKNIKSEVLHILDYMLPRGGYIPTVDHMVPPDVSFDNFLYYLEIKKNALNG